MPCGLKDIHYAHDEHWCNECEFFWRSDPEAVNKCMNCIDTKTTCNFQLEKFKALLKENKSKLMVNVGTIKQG